MIPSKIYNKKSKRSIIVGGAQYKKLLKDGFKVNQTGELSPPQKLTTSPQKSATSPQKLIISPQVTVTKSPQKLIMSPDKSVNTDIKNIIAHTQLLELLSPKDLLSLYLSNKDIVNELNTKRIIDSLNNKYNIDINTNLFPEWYKNYTLTQVNHHLKYLYNLENTRYINELKMNDIINGKSELNERPIFILFDWLYSVRKSFKLSFKTYPYACTLFFILASNKTLDLNTLQMYGCVCLHYAALIFEDNIPEVSDWVYISDGTFSNNEFELAKIEMFDALNGQLIYPSPILFVDQTVSTGEMSEGENILVLTMLSSLMLSISTYKPSLVAETCKYIITGEYTIYSIQEMNPICKEIVKYITKFFNSTLDNIKPRAELVYNAMKMKCGDESKSYTLQPLQYNEKWHLGNIVKGQVIGKGTYGEVSKVTRQKCGKDYVIKSTNSENYINEALNEIVLLNLLKNESHIIKLCGYEYDVDHVNMILPLMDGSLMTGYYKLDKQKYGNYFKQIVMGVIGMHANDIIHRDLKMENIVYKADVLEIIDFGSSIPFQSFRILKDTYMVNTLHYRPPECLIGINRYNQKVDIWAIGCIMYFMMTRTYIMKRYNDKEGLDDIFQLLGTPTAITWPEFSSIDKQVSFNNYPGNIDRKILYPYADLILACLTINPNKRPSAEALLTYF